ncbi:MAG: UDP-3-O-acyl-N-acetylglucosamine deacetylase [Pyrinomonadaceae bacterium]|jgi:UDP-3-O-[3-hydroxymyristoyl] N-acetylglucosamine deacetylase|nr:MAG: UDP-3-O-acyl-N-acetylglucosamine deacetylase [Pyrinomonadaceae bacterium]
MKLCSVFGAMNQTTIAKAVSLEGIGLHTGVRVSLTLKPAPENTGYVFIRTDLDDFEIPASVEYISHCSYATTLLRKGVIISTCEHLLSALRGAGVDNCFIELDNIELPILDGSSEGFIELIKQAGIKTQQAPKRFLKVLKRIEVVEGDRKITIEPWDKFEIDCKIDFPHPLIGQQTYRFQALNGNFEREIASARTFGFLSEVEKLRAANLALGGSLENAIVLTESGMLNKEPLRFKDEFVRHKILDIIGDFALLGMPILGKITAEKSGHALHALLMTRLLKDESAWEIITSNRACV